MLAWPMRPLLLLLPSQLLRRTLHILLRVLQQLGAGAAATLGMLLRKLRWQPQLPLEGQQLRQGPLVLMPLLLRPGGVPQGGRGLAKGGEEVPLEVLSLVELLSRCDPSPRHAWQV